MKEMQKFFNEMFVNLKQFTKVVIRSLIYITYNGHIYQLIAIAVCEFIFLTMYDV